MGFINLILKSLNENFGINSEEINAFFKTTESKNNPELVSNKLIEYLEKISIGSIIILNGIMNLKNQNALNLLELFINKSPENIKFILLSDEKINLDIKKSFKVFNEYDFLKTNIAQNEIEEIIKKYNDFISSTITLDEFNVDILKYLGFQNNEAILNELKKLKIIQEFEYKNFSYNNYFKKMFIEKNLTPKKEVYSKIAEYFEKIENKKAYEYYLKSQEKEKALENLNKIASEYFKNGYYSDLLEKYENFDFTRLNSKAYNYYLWSLFLSGSYHKCFFILKDINENSLNDNLLKLSIITLKIMSGSIKENLLEKIEEADLLMDKIDDEDYFMKLGMMLNLGNIHSNFGNVEKGIEYYRNCYFLSKNADEIFMEAVALTNYANRLYWNGDLLIAQHILENEINSKSFKKNGFDNIIKLILGIIYYEKSNLKESTKMLKEGVEFYINNSLMGLSGISEYYLFNSFKSIEDPKTAKKIYDEIIKLFSINLRSMRVNLIKQLYEGTFEKEIDIEFKQNNNILEYLLNVIYLKNKLQKNELENIEESLDNMISIATSKGLKIQLLRIYILESIYYYKINDKKQSKKNLKKAIEISNKLESYQAFKEFEMLEIKKLIDEFQLENQQLKSILKSNKINIGINFSKREQEIINHILNGDSNAQIAEKLYLSEGTVKWHISNIYKKANCKNRSSLIKLLK